MKFSKRKSILAVMLVMAGYGAASAEAQTVVLGGGSSLVGPSIQKEIQDFGGTLTYFTDSSGAGQTAFFNNDAPALVSLSVSGTVTTTLTASGTVDFANSDAALLAAQVTAYQAGLGATEGPLIQAPYIVTPITVPIVNGPTPTSTTTPQTTPLQPHSIALNDDDLCGIYSGKLTNWNEVTDPDTISLSNPVGTKYTASIPIEVVYRSDNSGTTELLTRHLSQVCHTAAFTRVVQGAGGPGTTATVSLLANSNVSFTDGQAFTANFGGTNPPLPTSFIGASGSGGVQSALLAVPTTKSGIGYLSPDWTNTFLATSSPSASAQLAVASLRNDLFEVTAPLGTTTVDIAPTNTQVDNALATASPPSGSAAADPTNWVPTDPTTTAYQELANPSVGYPVSGSSQIIVSQCYANPSVTSAVTSFLTDHYTNSEFISVVRNNGFDIPTAFVTAIQGDFLTASRGNTLNIGNSTVCAGGKGR
ncbi:substrate-binding domain-containing protein [Paraburkholderia sp. BCC1885]|uniref:substrate-binding domain-containing protein n=1 Tax=Paraburkholderia sp. BCC1885 TaxID=2562669 RepID=UPI0011828B90|nr:substrate-binding domain-containing protein [Paraburkholderia sp. BCC1885]